MNWHADNFPLAALLFRAILFAENHSSILFLICRIVVTNQTKQMDTTRLRKYLVDIAVGMRIAQIFADSMQFYQGFV